MTSGSSAPVRTAVPRIALRRGRASLQRQHFYRVLLPWLQLTSAQHGDSWRRLAKAALEPPDGFRGCMRSNIRPLPHYGHGAEDSDRLRRGISDANDDVSPTFCKYR